MYSGYSICLFGCMTGRSASSGSRGFYGSQDPPGPWRGSKEGVLDPVSVPNITVKEHVYRPTSKQRINVKTKVLAVG